MGSEQRSQRRKSQRPKAARRRNLQRNLVAAPKTVTLLRRSLQLKSAANRMKIVMVKSHHPQRRPKRIKVEAKKKRAELPMHTLKRHTKGAVKNVRRRKHRNLERTRSR